MKWINPRDKMPQPYQLIYVLVDLDREHSYGRIAICRAEPYQEKNESLDTRFVIMEAKALDEKGYGLGTTYYFYEYQYDYGMQDIGHSKHSDHEVIVAWAPFEGFPSWDFIDFAESKKIIESNEIYQENRKIHNSNKKIKLIQDNCSRFIRVEETLPVVDGVYVVANKGGVWLSRYEKKSCNPWYAPNGDLVLVWYKIPDVY